MKNILFILLAVSFIACEKNAPEPDLNTPTIAIDTVYEYPICGDIGLVRNITLSLYAQSDATFTTPLKTWSKDFTMSSTISCTAATATFQMVLLPISGIPNTGTYLLKKTITYSEGGSSFGPIGPVDFSTHFQNSGIYTDTENTVYFR